MTIASYLREIGRGAKGARHVGVLRGTEGEAVADPRREPRQRFWIGGLLQDELTGEPEPGA